MQANKVRNHLSYGLKDENEEWRMKQEQSR